MNNKLLIIGIILLILVIIQFNMIENFTQQEYLNYQNILNENCKRSSEVFNKLKKMNKHKCNKKGDTQKDTINNKSQCYDDTSKEIVAELDTTSYCKMVDNKTSKESENNNFEEQTHGPNFINNFFVDSYNSKNLDDFSMFDNTENKPLHNFPVTSSYSNISFSSDPAFLSRLNNKK